MKRTLYAIVLFSVLLFTSCSKEQLREADPDQPKIEFSLYNDTKTYFDVNASAQTITGVKVYTFVGTKNPQAENIFTLSFMTDSLQPGSYNTNTGVVTFREGSKTATNISSTDFIVTITSNVNGLVNGTFTGTLFDHQTGSNCAVVSGKIEDIQLSYR